MPISFADAIFWLGVASCAVAQAAILRSVLRMRRAQGASEGLPRPRFLVEVAWAVLPAVALAMLLVATWRTMHPRVPGATAPTIQVGDVGIRQAPGSGIR
jgi:hypothetical protein